MKKFLVIAGIMLPVLALTAYAGMRYLGMYSSDPVYTHGGLAIDGYDPVAYFTEAKPEKGAPEYSTQWNGARWQFASAEHRDAFVAAPEKFAPQFGGYCAYGMAQGHTAKIEPDVWTIVDGKLYLNFDQDVRGKWQANQGQFIKDAGANWPKVLR